MRMHVWIAAAALAGVCGTGCASWASSTAPTADGTGMYVTGRVGNAAVVWVCPSTKTGDDCRKIDVERTN